MYEISLEIEPSKGKQGISPLDFLQNLKTWLKQTVKDGKIKGYTLRSYLVLSTMGLDDAEVTEASK